MCPSCVRVGKVTVVLKEGPSVGAVEERTSEGEADSSIGGPIAMDPKMHES